MGIMPDSHTYPPWMVPLPGVKANDFRSLHPEHRGLGMITDLARIAPFRRATSVESTAPMLWSDLQTRPEGNAHNWIGSARSAVYEGHYLKGVGRTSLALQWNDRSDLLHTSGVLHTSSALREYFISVFAQEMGLEHAIVPCVGLLVRPMPAELRGYERAIVRQLAIAGAALPSETRVDDCIQAISVKPASFARMSNITWYCLHAARRDGESFLAGFMRHFWRGLGGDPQRAGRVDAGELAALFYAKVDAGVENLLVAWELGLDWGSLGNNFSLDGRFLDLETPTVFRAPFLGVETDAMEARRPTISVRSERLPGLAAWHYAMQCRIFVRTILARLREHVGSVYPSNRAAGAFVAQVTEAFESGQTRALAFDTSELSRRVRQLVQSRYGMGPGAKDLRLLADPRSSSGQPLELLAVRWSPRAYREEYALSDVYAPAAVRDALMVPSEPADTINRVLVDARNIDDVDRLLEHVRDGELRVRSACREARNPRVR